MKVALEDECKWHISDWKKRLAAYDRIRWNGWAIQENIRRVLRGEIPKRLLQPRQNLALPAPALSVELVQAKTHAAKAGQ
jgi:hypothetical protein